MNFLCINLLLSKNWVVLNYNAMNRGVEIYISNNSGKVTKPANLEMKYELSHFKGQSSPINEDELVIYHVLFPPLNTVPAAPIEWCVIDEISQSIKGSFSESGFYIVGTY